MKGVYPAVFTEADGTILVEVPDLEILTEGKDFNSAIEMARDAIELKCVSMEDGGEENEQVHKAGYYPNRGGRGCGVHQAPVYRYVRDTQECGNHVQPA